jgi:hypothetical protein
MYIKQVVCEAVDRFNLIMDRVQLWDFLYTEKNVRIP